MSKDKDTALKITKVRRTRKHILIEFTSDHEERSLKSSDNPLPAFTKALDALAPLVCEIVGLPPTYTQGLTVTGLSAVTAGGNEHVLLTAKKELHDNNRPFNIVTPLRLTDVPEEEGSYSPPLSDAQLALVADVIDEAAAYIKGDRAQGQIQFEGTADDDPNEDGDGDTTEEPSQGDPLPFPTGDVGTPVKGRKKRSNS